LRIGLERKCSLKGGGQMLPAVKPITIWLTINRACNMCCRWCYARGAKTTNQEMSFELAQKLVDLVVGVGAKEILLLGGEPTLWPWLLDLNKYCKGRINTTLVTNTVLFANDIYWNRYLSQSNDEIGVSLKASCEKKFNGVSTVTNWETTLAGIRRALSLTQSGTSFVCSPDDCDIISAAQLVRSLGGDRLNLNLYTPVCVGGEWKSDYSWNQIRQVINQISIQYSKAEKILKGKLYLNGKFPLCVWPTRFIEERRAKGQISTGCQLSRRRGLIFDTDGSVLMCNHLQEYPIGKYGVDFVSPEELLGFLDEKAVKETYDQASRFPSTKCDGCEDYDFCTGGCPILWTYFNPEDIIQRERR